MEASLPAVSARSNPARWRASARFVVFKAAHTHLELDMIGGSLELRVPDDMHVGYSLFPGGVGKTNSPEDFSSLITDVSERLFDPLPDATWVYPGHGNDTTLGAERPHVGEWRERGW